MPASLLSGGARLYIVFGFAITIHHIANMFVGESLSSPWWQWAGSCIAYSTFSLLMTLVSKYLLTVYHFAFPWATLLLQVHKNATSSQHCDIAIDHNGTLTHSSFVQSTFTVVSLFICNNLKLVEISIK